MGFRAEKKKPSLFHLFAQILKVRCEHFYDLVKALFALYMHIFSTVVWILIWKELLKFGTHAVINVKLFQLYAINRCYICCSERRKSEFFIQIHNSSLAVNCWTYHRHWPLWQVTWVCSLIYQPAIVDICVFCAPLSFSHFQSSCLLIAEAERCHWIKSLLWH